MRKPRVLILDFDGVIIESNDVKTEAFERVFSRFPERYEEMMAYHHANVSVGRLAKFQLLQRLMGKEGDEAFLAEVAHAFSAHVLAEMAKVPLVAGAMEFLAAATGCLPVYLASVTPIEELSQILDMRDLRHWFEDVYGCPPWNKPDAIRDVLKREGAAPGETLLIGDSAGDQRAALATGVPFIARDSGLGFDLPLPARFGDLIQIMSHLRTEHSWPI